MQQGSDIGTVTKTGLDQEMPCDPSVRKVNLADPFSSDETLKHYFKYHAPTSGDIGNYQAINDAALRFAVALRRHVPAGADRDDALRFIRLARMMANAGIAIKA